MQASMDHIKERYGVERKDAEELQKKAGKMAGAMAAFCERMGHRDLALLISRFQVGCSPVPCIVHLPVQPPSSVSLASMSHGGVPAWKGILCMGLLQHCLYTCTPVNPAMIL